MEFISRIRIAAAMALALSYGAAPAPAAAETLVGSNVDSRVLVGFAVDAGDVQPLLPEGWAPVPFPGGPLEGTNLLMVLVDRKLQLDAEGKPDTPPVSRAMALVGLGKQGDAVRLYVYRIYATPEGYDPYGNAVQAEIAHTTSTGGPANDGRSRQDDWMIAAEGGELSLSLSFTTGTATWLPDQEVRPFSNVDPDFSRIYRYDQLVEVVMSAPLGKPLAGGMAFATSVPGLADIFDGTQETVAILDVPVYVREIYLP